MIYLVNGTEAQTVFVPQSDYSGGTPTGFGLVDTTTGKNYSFSVADLGTSGLYYRIAVELPEGMEPGEYEYRLSPQTRDISVGLAMVVGITQTVQYENTFTYEQYIDN